jgi:hypothetical protein
MPGNDPLTLNDPIMLLLFFRIPFRGFGRVDETKEGCWELPDSHSIDPQVQVGSCIAAMCSK